MSTHKKVQVLLVGNEAWQAKVKRELGHREIPILSNKGLDLHWEKNAHDARDWYSKVRNRQVNLIIADNSTERSSVIHEGVDRVRSVNGKRYADSGARALFDCPPFNVLNTVKIIYATNDFSMPRSAQWVPMGHPDRLEKILENRLTELARTGKA